MKIAFIGDSITKGTHGVSYIDILQEKFPSHELVNLGVGGDTIVSLSRRVKKITNLDEYEKVFIFVGVNDLLSRLTLAYKVIKLMMNQPWSKDENEFAMNYENLLFYMETKCEDIIVIPPLLIGEDVNNIWNEKIDTYVKKIKVILKNHPQIKYLDIRKKFIEYLSKRNISDYMPLSASQMKRDGETCKNNADFDKVSKERKLHLTLDGVHINSRGASIIANGIGDIL